MQLPPDVRRAINRRAHSLAQASAAHYRAVLERRAAELLKRDPTTDTKPRIADVVAAINVAQVVDSPVSLAGRTP